MTIGTEWDYVKRDEPSTPANLVMLSSQVIPLASQAAVYNGSTYLNNGVFNYGLSLYRANSGALVFNTGSWRFTFGLARLRNNQIDLSGPVDPIMQQGAINLLCDMGISSGTLMGVVQNGNPTLLVAPGSPAPAAAYGLTMTPSHYQTILKPEQEPIVRNAADGNDYTLATVFTSSVDGNVHGVRWYFSDTLPSQQVIGLLFSWGSETTGVELARVTFSNIQTGWCEALFSAPVAITANTKYVVAVWTADAFAASNSFFAASDVTQGNLTAPKDGSGGLHNGKYTASAHGVSYPGSTYQASCYFCRCVIYRERS